MISNKFVIFFLLLIWNLDCVAQIKNEILSIGKSEILHANILGEDRVINICLPDNYRSDDTTSYPVVYVLDGGMEEDFFHIAGLIRYNAQPWIARFPSSIVVGIGGNMRRRDFTFPVENIEFIEKVGFKKSSFPSYGGSRKYMTFLKDELQPYITMNYKTNGDRTLIGESLAGLFATEVLLKQPELFDNYIIVSPSLWWGDESLLKNAKGLLQTHLKKGAKIYLGVPNKDEDVRMYNESVELFDYLKENQNIDVVFDYLPDELHATVIHQAVYNAFKKMFPKTF